MNLVKFEPRCDITQQLADFCSNQHRPDRITLDGFTDQLERNGTPRFVQEMPGMLPATPVLLDDEYGLERTLSEMAQQRPIAGPRQPALIVAGNTSTWHVNQKLLDDNLDILRRFTGYCTDHDIPFSHFRTTYPDRTSMGQIRFDMHGAHLNFYARQTERLKETPDDILIVGGDADLRRAQRNYWHDLHRQRQADATAAWLGGPAVRHELLDGPFPRTNAVLQWYDHVHSSSTVSAHYGVNSQAYMAVRGMDRWGNYSTYGEIVGVNRAIRERFPTSYQHRRNICEVWVSPRQLVYQMHATEDKKIDYDDLSTSSEEDRTPYRRYTPTEDISADRLREVLSWTIRVFISKTKWKLVEGTENEQAAIEEPAVHTRALAMARIVAAEIGDPEGIAAELIDKRAAPQAARA